MFAAMWITALIYWLLRGRELRPLALWMAVMLIAPLIIDGLTHMISDGASVTAGFRYDNQWLSELSGGIFGANFYAGDGIGTFNYLMRLFTGIAFGIGLMGYALVRVEGYFHDRATILADKLADWHRRQQTT
jgi:uncharacterized membrane protein